MTVSYPTLDDYLHTAAYVLDLPVETVIKSARIELAESALHAPQAGWGEVEFYPELPMKAAVLLVRLAKNRPLPDGNKRAAYLVMIEFLARNGQRFIASDMDATIDMMVKIAGSEVDQAEVEDWIRRQLQ